MGNFFLLPQYLLARIKNEFNDTNSNKTEESCTIINKSDPHYILSQKIQAESSRLLGYNLFAAGVPSILTVFLYGAISDRYGRKVVVSMNFCGMIVSSLMLTFVVNFNLSFFLYVGVVFVCGFSGSYSSILAAAFAYVADITTKDQRNVAIGFMEGCLGLSMVVTTLLVGFWIKADGFDAPVIGMSTITAVSVCFLIFVKETRQKRRPSSVNSADSICSNICQAVVVQIQDIKKLLLVDKKRTACLLLLVAAFFCHSSAYIASLSITTLYLMDKPLCLNSAQIGVFTALKTVVWMVGGFIIVVLLKKRVKDITLIRLGLITFAITSILFGLSSAFDKKVSFVLVLLGTVVGAMISVCPILIRAVASKFVSADEQGAIFGLIATGEALAIAIGPTALTILYSSTVSVCKGCVFYVSSGIAGIALIFIQIFGYISHSRMEYTEFVNVVE